MPRNSPACLDAIRMAASRSSDGRVPHSPPLELFTDAGQGTKIGGTRNGSTGVAETGGVPRGDGASSSDGVTAVAGPARVLEREYAIPTYIRNPVQFVLSAAEGCRLGLAHGRIPRLPCGDLGLNVGHCHPRVLADESERSPIQPASTAEPAFRLSAELSRSSLAGKVFLCTRAPNQRGGDQLLRVACARMAR